MNIIAQLEFKFTMMLQSRTLATSPQRQSWSDIIINRFIYIYIYIYIYNYIKIRRSTKRFVFFEFIYFVLTYVLYICMFLACCFRQRISVTQGLINGVLILYIYIYIYAHICLCACDYNTMYMSLYLYVYSCVCVYFEYIYIYMYLSSVMVSKLD